MFYYFKLREVTDDDLQFLCVIVEKYKEPQIRVNALQIVSGFGCALSKLESVHPQLTVSIRSFARNVMAYITYERYLLINLFLV